MTDEQLIDEVLTAIDAGAPRDGLLRDPEHGEAFADILKTIDLLENAGAQIVPDKRLLKKMLPALGGVERLASKNAEEGARSASYPATPIPEFTKGRTVTHTTPPPTMSKVWKIMVPVLVALIVLAGALYYWNLRDSGGEYAADNKTAPASTPTETGTQAGGTATVVATGDVDDAVATIDADANAEAALMNQELNDSSSAALSDDAQAMGGFDSSYGDF